jgi:spore coat protein U-like protein
MKNVLKLLSAALLAGAVSGAVPASAATQTSGMSVTMGISASCTISTPAAPNLGTSISDLSTVHTATTNVPVNCSNGAAYKLVADNGTNYDSINSIRRMANGSNYISYSLYTDSGYSSPFPSTLAAATNQAGTGAVTNIPVYAKVGGQALPPPGSYTDTVTLTVNY